MASAAPGLEARGLWYAVGIGTPTVVWTVPPVPGEPRRRPAHPPLSVKAWAQQHEREFRYTRWHEGTKCALRSRFWATPVPTAPGWQMGHEPGPPAWLRVEWPEDELAPTQYFLLRLPGRSRVRRLVPVAQSRHWIEQDDQHMKEERGLDHCAGRSWRGWHHHVTLVMLAHAFLQRERCRRRSKSEPHYQAHAAAGAA